MRCDIIIPVWNQPDFTRDCIESLTRHTKYPYRLILIDNASDDKTRLYLEGLKKKRPDEVELIVNKENLGFVRAVNQGLRASMAPYVCIMNNDTVAYPGWLEAMVEFAEAHKDVGLVNPQCDRNTSVPMEDYLKEMKANKGKYMEMNQCFLFCALIKRELIDKIGYLDEAFGIGGYDDTDYSMRAHMAGYRCACIYNAYVYHRMHASFNKAGNREEWVRRNRRLYYRKWGRHLRVGIACSFKDTDPEAISRIVRFSYGLAREWSWVHLWINAKYGKELAQTYVDEAIANNELPPHQNIRFYFFSLPAPVFALTLAGKVVERMRRRMKDKRYSALIIDDGLVARMVRPFANMALTQIIERPFDKRLDDWLERGRETALSIKEHVIGERRSSQI